MTTTAKRNATGGRSHLIIVAVDSGLNLSAQWRGLAASLPRLGERTEKSKYEPVEAKQSQAAVVAVAVA